MKKFSALKYCLFFIIYFLSTSNGNEIWWPNNCGIIDTVIKHNEILLVEYICKKNGRFVKRTSKNGKFHGPYTEWDSTGIVLASFSYHNDELDGKLQRWDSTGFLLRDRKYKLGIPFGYHKDYYSKDNPKSFTNYDSTGKKHGLCETWREDGTRKDSIVFENGKFVEEKRYFTNGKLRHYNKYKDGVVWESKAYSPTGEKLGTIKNGMGVIKKYSEDGKSIYLLEYKNGREISCKLLKQDE